MKNGTFLAFLNLNISGILYIIVVNFGKEGSTLHDLQTDMTYGDLGQRSRSQGEIEMWIVCSFFTLNVSDTSCSSVLKFGQMMTMTFDLDF